MQPNPKQVIQSRLKTLGLTQAQLAEQLGTTPSILSRTLKTPLVRQDSHWPAILDALALTVEITIPLEEQRGGEN
ncbi:helix-turn-helix domain-containing protein [Deinococcus aerophilus]|uniref:HTH cro/C1-type domain-containing protein n=1 Tax=Deinococcus aerophilus TaxID=522488 RepID=A0ABQ2GZY3_9DEIO|nr:helix-turn-helix transcriptional regulator [Deinococcus aerophilus]GGM22320.1 hypothetical protein GCM10010841_32750 [Deinococcus aerophilus]